jgi:hypothetical protein
MSEGLIMAQQHKAIKKLQAEVELLNEEWTKRDVLLQAAEAKIDALAAAVRWALGEGDSDFGNDLPPDAKRYWWRKELRERAFGKVKE